jgi:hypothetical protein
MALWYYGNDGGQSGPVEEQEMRAMLATGIIDRATLVWTDGMDQWRRLGEVPPWNAQLAGGVVPVPGYYPGMVRPTNGLAVASLVCGICSLLLMVTCWLGIFAGVPAVICGHLSLGQLRRSGALQQGRGMAIAGLVTGYLSCLATVAALVGLIFLFVTAEAAGAP